MSRCRFWCLSCSSRIPPWPWTIAFGSPVVPLEYRTHSGWSKSTGSSTSGESATRAEEPVLPAAAVEVAQAHERPADARVDLLDDAAAVEIAAAVAIAVDREQHRRLDLGEAVDHRARAEVRRAARPDRAEAGGGQKRRDRLGDVRHVRRDAVAGTDAERAQAGLDARRSARAAAPTSSPPAAAARRRGGSPPRRRRGRGRCARGRRASRLQTSCAPGISRRSSTVRGASWKRTSKYSAIEDQKPSRSPTDQRHSSS